MTYVRLNLSCGSYGRVDVYRSNHVVPIGSLAGVFKSLEKSKTLTLDVAWRGGGGDNLTDVKAIAYAAAPKGQIKTVSFGRRLREVPTAWLQLGLNAGWRDRPPAENERGDAL